MQKECKVKVRLFAVTGEPYKSLMIYVVMVGAKDWRWVLCFIKRSFRCASELAELLEGSKPGEMAARKGRHPGRRTTS